MATTGVAEHNLINEVNPCSICLEQYKVPVVLPCSHSFCQACLATHITSSCVNLDPPLGFPCPLCHLFIPAPGRIGQHFLDEWATEFPENKLLECVINESPIFCKPCIEDEEKVSANGWCQDCSEALCDACVKYHKKCRPSRHHVVISITDWSVSAKKPISLDICHAHYGHKFELFCKKHLQPCCSVCVAQEHASCSAFCHLEVVDENLLGTEMEECLQNDVEKFCSTIEQTIREEKENMDNIDDVSDKFRKELSELTAAIIQVVKRLEEKHLDQLAKLSKESKSKLQQSVESFEQRLQYLLYWKEALLKKDEETSQKNRVLSYTKMKNIFKYLQDHSYSKLEICIQTKFSETALQIKNVPCLAELTLSEHLNHVNVIPEKLDLATAKVKTEGELHLNVSSVFSGDFRGDGKLLLVGSRKLILCDSNCVFQEKKLSYSPFGVCIRGKNEALVTLQNENKVLRLDTDSLDIKETVSLPFPCYGIATSGNTTVIGTRNSVVMFLGGLENTECTVISNDLSSTDDVALDNEGNIVYSSYSKNTVRKQDRVGNVLFSYTHRKLKSPYGLTIKRNGEIFVGGYKSNNIHILSKSGQLLRIMEGVAGPTMVKFQNDTNRLFVKESGSNLKVFKFIAPRD